jgi:hypothetical protein
VLIVVAASLIANWYRADIPIWGRAALRCHFPQQRFLLPQDGCPSDRVANP